MKIKKILVTFIFGALPLMIFAKGPVDVSHATGNYLAYPIPAEGIPTLSPAPKGYVPFHMEHYGRHGSRWRINPAEYSNAMEIMQKAHDNGKLTPRGEELFEEISIIVNDSKGRLGELTPLGHRQHRGIANRMAKNFPEIFNESTLLDAKSTEVIRCILSMANEVTELQRLFPEMPINMDASQTTQNILNYNNLDTVARQLNDAAQPYLQAYRESLPKPDAFFDKLFTDRQFVRDSIGEAEAFKAIYDLAINTQSHDNYKPFLDVFTEEEMLNEWKARNARWYIMFGNTPLTNNRTFYNQRVLLRNIIESADTAMMSPRVSANLRFGHDTMLMPLGILMELDDLAYETSDLTTLADNWRDYEIFPMAGNIQIVFYRPEKKDYQLEDILVKVLLNEKETSLPIKPVEGNYYRWSDLRDYYLKKISNLPGGK